MNPTKQGRHIGERRGSSLARLHAAGGGEAVGPEHVNGMNGEGTAGHPERPVERLELKTTNRNRRELTLTAP